MKLVQIIDDPYSLEKFTNEEFYYIISSLLGLGDPGFVPERLYLSFDQNSLDALEEIKFLFMTSNLIQSDDGEKEVTEYTVGKIDSEFDNIEIYRWHCAPEVMSPEKPEVDVALIRLTLREQNTPLPFRPVSFIKGINRIVSSEGFEKRNDNDLFNLKWHVHISHGIQNQFDFGQIGNLGTDFSGNYFLVVEPDRTNMGRMTVNSFHVSVTEAEDPLSFDIERAHVSQRFIDSTSIQLYENDLTSSVLTATGELKKHKENLLSKGSYEAYKANKIAILGETIIGLINDLLEKKRRELLNGEPIEDFVKYSQEKYEEEFDLHVDDLGVIGADEVAWKEALGELKEQADETVRKRKHHFLFHDFLFETSCKISSGYSKLAFNFPSDDNAFNWEEMGREWNNYSLTLKDLLPTTREAGENEVARLLDVYHELINIEDKMYQLNSTVLKIIP